MDDSIRQIESIEKVIWPLLISILSLSLGYKIYNPFKGRNTPEKEIEFYSKYGKFYKIGGYIILAYSAYNLFFLLSGSKT
jgi:hypothetical protein